MPLSVTTAKAVTSAHDSQHENAGHLMCSQPRRLQPPAKGHSAGTPMSLKRLEIGRVDNMGGAPPAAKPRGRPHQSP